jgi:oligoribonuclease NrnB/cAMP/cGMP phosphodiesterase (DHH superfamily)
MKVIYHKADMDGIASAAILYQLHPDAEFIGADYGMEPTFDYSRDETIYVVDFTFEPLERMVRFAQSSNLIWIDHHKSSIEYYEKYKLHFNTDNVRMGDLQNTKSACELLFEYLSPETKIPETIKYLSLFDTWHHNNDPKVLNFQLGAGMKLRDFKDQRWNILLRGLTNSSQYTAEEECVLMNEMTELGSYIQEYVDKTNEAYAKGCAREIMFEGYKALVINRTFTSSFMFKSVYKSDRHDLMIAWAQLANGLYKYTLYSDKEYVDCSVLAKKYNGGGHKGAAGFQTDIHVLS